MEVEEVKKIELCEINADMLDSDKVLAVGSCSELNEFYTKVASRVWGDKGKAVLFALKPEREEADPSELHVLLTDFIHEDEDRCEAETNYLEEIAQRLENIREELADNGYHYYAIIFAADFWNMLERKVLGRSSKKCDDKKDSSVQYTLVEKIIKLTTLITRNKNVKLFIFRDEYNTTKYYRNPSILTELELSCQERIFLSFGNTLNITGLSQELAAVKPDTLSALDVCYDLSGGKVGYIYKREIPEECKQTSMERYTLEFLPQHFVECTLIDKIDMTLNIIIDDGVSGPQKESLALYSPVEKIASIIDESEDPYRELYEIVLEAVDHKQLLDATAIKDPVKRQMKIAKYKSAETQEYIQKMVTAVTEVLIKLIAVPQIGSKREGIE